MKILISKLILIVALITTMGTLMANAENSKNGSNNEQRYMAPGPVTSVSENYSSLPQSIKTFLLKYIPNATVAEIEMKTMKDIYKIEMSNGAELVFTTAGQWLSFEAPDKATLSSQILQALLPAPAFKHLTDKNLLNKVDEIKYNPRKGYKVELDNHSKKDLYFSTTGALIKEKYGKKHH
ncbi:MAG: PepSY-like domain-containing protein [Muribaculaceae bacterium]